MSRFICVLTVVCSCAYLSLTTVTLAKEETATLSEARSAFIEGRELIDEEKWEEAEQRFRFAARVKNTPGLKYYVAYCQERAGRLVEALATYEDAAELLQTTPAADVEDLIPEARDRVSNALPQLAIQGAPEGAVALVDGQELAKPLAGPVNPGNHELRVQAKGYEPYLSQLKLGVGDAEVIQVDLLPLAVESKDSPRLRLVPQANVEVDSIPETSLRPLVFWGSVGLGAVGLGVGIYGTISRTSASSDVDDANEKLDEIARGSSTVCSMAGGETGRACDQLEEGLQKKNRTTLLMIGGFSIAAVGATGALLTHLLWEESTLSIGGFFTPQASELAIRGSF